MTINKKNSPTTRVDWIDAIRALAITFVVYGHAARGFDLFTTLSGPIKMPLFFVLSGFLFKSNKVSLNGYLIKTIQHIMVPWICLGLISCIPDLVKQTPSKFFESLYKLLTGQSFWFMPCFVLSSLINYFYRRFFTNEWIWILISIMSGILGVILTKYHIGDLFMINRAIHVQVYFAFGYVIKSIIEQLKSLSKTAIWSMWGFYTLLIAISLYLYPHKAIDLHHCDYYVYWISIPLIIVGTISIFSSFSSFNKIPSIISDIGKNTLVIYLLHGSCFFIFELVFKSYKDVIPVEVYSLAKTGFSMFACLGISIVLRKYCPFIVGEIIRK